MPKSTVARLGAPTLEDLVQSWRATAALGLLLAASLTSMLRTGLGVWA